MCRKGQDKYDRTDLTVLDRLKGLDHTEQTNKTGLYRTGHTQDWIILDRTGPY